MNKINFFQSDCEKNGLKGKEEWSKSEETLQTVYDEVKSRR